MRLVNSFNELIFIIIVSQEHRFLKTKYFVYFCAYRFMVLSLVSCWCKNVTGHFINSLDCNSGHALLCFIKFALLFDHVLRFT